MAKDDLIKTYGPWKTKQFHSDPKLNELLNKYAEAVYKRTLRELESQRIAKEQWAIIDRVIFERLIREYNERAGKSIRITNSNELIGSDFINRPRLSNN